MSETKYTQGEVPDTEPAYRLQDASEGLALLSPVPNHVGGMGQVLLAGEYRHLWGDGCVER